MTKKIWIVGVVIVVILVVVLSRENRTPVGTFRIGATEPLSGTATYYGESSKKGIDLALDIAREKYPRITFELYHEDNQFNPKVGVDAYTKLRTEHNIDAVITQTSPVAVAVKSLAEKDGILQMAVSASASTYSSLGDLSFRTTGDSSNETAVMASLIKDKYASTALLGMNNEIGVSNIIGIEKQLSDRNLPIISKQMFPVETVDFRTQLIKLKQDGVTNVYFAGLASQVATFLKQASEFDMNIDVLTFRTGEDPVLIKNAGILAERVIFTSGFDPDSDDVTVKKFVSEYKKKYNEFPNSYSAEAYVGAMFVFDALAMCGTDSKCIFDYLSTLKDYPTVLGSISFDESGNIYYPFFLKTVRDGKFVRYE